MKYTTGKRRELRLSSLAVLSLGVASCGPSVDQPLSLPDEPVQFANPTECMAAGYEMTGCHDAYEAALTQHQAEAPKYANQMVCEEDWGASNCQQIERSSGGGFFMPFMTGYLLSNALNGSRQNYYRAGTALGSPIYRGRNGPVQYQRKEDEAGGEGGVIYGGNNSVRRNYAASTVPVTATRPAARPNVASSTTSRGGFGSSMSGGGKSFGG